VSAQPGITVGEFREALGIGPARSETKRLAHAPTKELRRHVGVNVGPPRGTLFTRVDGDGTAAGFVKQRVALSRRRQPLKFCG
jgi:hypothetical protein